jgi:hypothetical protein
MRIWEQRRIPCSGAWWRSARGKGNRLIPHGKCFSGMSFFLSSPRVATTMERDDVDLVTIINDYISIQMNEFLK